jgi:hypothetical protein
MVPTLVAFGLLMTAPCAAGKEVADMLSVYLTEMGLCFEILVVLPLFFDQIAAAGMAKLQS